MVVVTELFVDQRARQSAIGKGGAGLHARREVRRARRDLNPSFGTTMGSYDPSSKNRGAGVSNFLSCPVSPYSCV